MKIDNKIIANLREDYSSKTFDKSDVADNPFKQFGVWFDEAMKAKITEPNAMTIATASKDGVPSARIVLLKGFTEEGFIFYTNYNSQKGQEIEANPNVALVFGWIELERQVRIAGTITKISEEESTAYFHSRPLKSQMGAMASPQSSVVESRETIEANYNRIEEEYKGANQIPKPEHWGGYIVKPTKIEFWQGRSSRLHDRIVYKTQSEGENWTIERLAP